MCKWRWYCLPYKIVMRISEMKHPAPSLVPIRCLICYGYYYTWKQLLLYVYLLVCWSSECVVTCIEIQGGCKVWKLRRYYSIMHCNVISVNNLLCAYVYSEIMSLQQPVRSWAIIKEIKHPIKLTRDEGPYLIFLCIFHCQPGPMPTPQEVLHRHIGSKSGILEIIIFF